MPLGDVHDQMARFDKQALAVGVGGKGRSVAGKAGPTPRSDSSSRVLHAGSGCRPITAPNGLPRHRAGNPVRTFDHPGKACLLPVQCTKRHNLQSYAGTFGKCRAFRKDAHSDRSRRTSQIFPDIPLVVLPRPCKAPARQLKFWFRQSIDDEC